MEEYRKAHQQLASLSNGLLPTLLRRIYKLLNEEFSKVNSDVVFSEDKINIVILACNLLSIPLIVMALSRFGRFSC